jgi:pimeloyl-ACP methyl ester carboxylesterase
MPEPDDEDPMPTHERSAPLQARIHATAPRTLRSRARSLLIVVWSALVGVAAIATEARAIEAFPKAVRAQNIDVNDTTLHVRTGGSGPAVVMLHGFADTGDMWAPLTSALIADHTVIVPDLRGMGLSAHPESGYDKKNQALDIAAIMDKLGVRSAQLVTHDIGNMVGYALVAQFPDRIFYNELSANPKAIDDATRAHYARLYALPGAMHSAFNQFAAFSQDAEDNKSLSAKGKLAMPVLAVGGEKSYGKAMADLMQFVATDVTSAVVPDSGHWIMEEQPAFAVRMIKSWLQNGKL